MMIPVDAGFSGIKAYMMSLHDHSSIFDMRVKPDSTSSNAHGLFSAMTHWYQSPLGESLLQTESEIVHSMLQRKFGYHLLQLGCCEHQLFDPSPIGHKFSFNVETTARNQCAIAAAEALPLESESVDLVILHHSLDYSSQQHQLLREVDRILIAGGHVIIVGFNPWSSWGIRNKWPLATTPPWCSRLLSAGRIVDWLTLLEFTIEDTRYGQYSLPVNSPSIIRYSSRFGNLARKLNWPTGGIYAISARKQGIPLNPVHEPWHKLTAAGVVLPAADRIPGISNKSKVIH